MDSTGQFYRSPLLEEDDALQEVLSLSPSAPQSLRPPSHHVFGPQVLTKELSILDRPEKTPDSFQRTLLACIFLL